MAKEWAARSPWDFAGALRTARDDLVARGADLEPSTLLSAYAQGIFPMPGEGDVWWFSPRRRAVLPLDGLRVSRSLRRSCRDFEIRVDTAFAEVIAGCGDPDRPGADVHGWINDDIAAAYLRLHELGHAHSVETWLDGELVGGLYGVGIGGLFAGESMFHRVRDASKVALVALVERLREPTGIAPDGAAEEAGASAATRLLDVQWQTPHLASLGVVEIDRTEYLARLELALTLPPPSWA
ncbi:leucyl/phenylalanyl-tRNA--protein transferase [Nocardioides limicola]|uniref:leucyl/phenylalanyl-tRNA--protein transferase n=1 Tax=Nocardioides limicola TaxID=2803368 RepID=UPI003558125E